MTSAMPLMPTPPMPTKWTRGNALARSPVCCRRRRRAVLMRKVRNAGGAWNTECGGRPGSRWTGSLGHLQDGVGDAFGRVGACDRARGLRHLQKARTFGEDLQRRRQAASEVVVVLTLRQQLRGAAVDQVLRVLGLVVVHGLR